MKKITLLLSLSISVTLFAQEKGIHFESGTWASIVTKAKAEHKLIYVDVYTTWCGPCKFMSSTLFPNEIVGKKYNLMFINSSCDAEKGEGTELAKKYKVSGFPTNLFIDASNEKIVYKTMGSPKDYKGLIKNADIALEELQDSLKMQDYNRIYNSGTYDKIFLERFIAKNDRLGNSNNKYVDSYLKRFGAKLSDSLKYDFIATYEDNMSSTSESFTYILSHKNLIHVSSKKRQRLLETLIFNGLTNAKDDDNEIEFNKSIYLMKTYYEDGYEYAFDDLLEFYTKHKNKVKLQELYTEYGNYFSKLTDESLQKRDSETWTQILGNQKEMWKIKGYSTEKIDSLVTNIKPEDVDSKIISTKTANYINTICWNTFENFPKNKKLVSSSLIWIQRAMNITAQNDKEWCAFADTYAHLLALENKKQEAKKIEQEALSKMKKNKLEGIESYECFIIELEK